MQSKLFGTKQLLWGKFDQRNKKILCHKFVLRAIPTKKIEIDI